MTLAYLVSQYPAASHTFIRREIEALRERGLDIKTFSVRRPGSAELESARDRVEADNTYYLLPLRLKELLLAHGAALFLHPVAYVRVFRLALKHRVPGIRALIWATFHFAEAIQLAHALKRCKAKRLHNHFANSGATVGLLASQFLRIPWSLTLHGISETDYPAGLLLSAKIQAASFVACVSEFGRAQAMRITPPTQWHKLSIVRCALNFSDLPQRRRHEGGNTRLICVGRLSPEKGHLGLLEAFQKIRRQGVNADLILVGDGPERATIENAIRRFDLQGSVTLKGAMSENATLAEMAQSDLLVLASFMEGLPVVLMEAMAIGIPVVATRVAGIPELIDHQKEGLLFTPANWDDLAEQLLCLLNSGSLRNQLALAGYSKALSQHNISTSLEAFSAKLATTAD